MGYYVYTVYVGGDVISFNMGTYKGGFMEGEMNLYELIKCRLPEKKDGRVVGGLQAEGFNNCVAEVRKILESLELPEKKGTSDWFAIGYDKCIDDYKEVLEMVQENNE